MQYKSALMTEATGHIDGLVASHNRWGHYFRPRVTPVNPSTQRQSDVRSIFANMVQLWMALTPAQRESWEEFAANTPQKNRLGQDIYLTGQNAYIKAQFNLSLAEAPQAPLTDAPAVFNNGQAVSVPSESFVFDPNTGQWWMTPERADVETVDGLILIFRGKPQNPSRNFYAGPYQLADVEAITAASTDQLCTATIGVDDLCDFLIPNLDVMIPWRIRVAYLDGRLSHSEILTLTPELTTTIIV